VHVEHILMSCRKGKLSAFSSLNYPEILARGKHSTLLPHHHWGKKRFYDTDDQCQY